MHPVIHLNTNSNRQLLSYRWSVHCPLAQRVSSFTQFEIINAKILALTNDNIINIIFFFFFCTESKPKYLMKWTKEETSIGVFFNPSFQYNSFSFSPSPKKKNNKPI